MNSQTRLRKVYLHDRASFQEIARAAYYQNYFDHWNTKAGVDQYIEEQFGTARLQIELVETTIENNFIEYKGELEVYNKLNLIQKASIYPQTYANLKKSIYCQNTLGKGSKQALSSVLNRAKRRENSCLFICYRHQHQCHCVLSKFWFSN